MSCSSRGGGIVEVDLALVGEHDGGVQADDAALAVVDGAHLEALGVSANEARLAATVAEERAVITPVWAKTQEPRLLPPGKVMESS